MRATMKTIAALFVPLFALAMLSAQAQEQSPEEEPAAQSAPAADESLFSEPPLLLQPTPETEEIQPPKKKQPPKTTRNPQSITVDEIKVRILMRKAKTKALTDPRLHELLAEADAAKTDPEKRAILRRYYELLYKRMSAANPELAPFIETQRAGSLARLESPRLRDLGLDHVASVKKETEQ